MKIGILDSGIGGLTVLKECLKHIPNHEYLYYADSKNAPYGTKTQELVTALTTEAVEFLISKGAQIIVIACNTATSAAANMLRQTYDLPIIGMEPAIKPALALAGEKRVLVTATELTLKANKLLNLARALGGDGIIDLCPLGGLVELAESGEFGEEKVLAYLKSELKDYDTTQYASVVLGCTHFPLYKEIIAKLFPETTVLVDGTTGTLNRIKTFITQESDSPSVEFFLSKESLLEGEMLDLIWRILKS